MYSDGQLILNLRLLLFKTIELNEACVSEASMLKEVKNLKQRGTDLDKLNEDARTAPRTRKPIDHMTITPDMFVKREEVCNVQFWMTL